MIPRNAIVEEAVAWVIRRAARIARRTGTQLLQAGDRMVWYAVEISIREHLREQDRGGKR